jgi:hypothetical protein
MALSTPFFFGVQRGAQALNKPLLILQFMLPNPQNAPSALPKNAPYANVAHPIHRDFPSPIDSVALGCSQMLRATMPKAAIHKHRDAFF